MRRRTSAAAGRDRRRAALWALALIALAGATTAARSCARPGVDTPARDVPTTGEALQAGEISWIYDGDTFAVTGGDRQEKVRLIGIDAPEADERRGAVECFGHEATRYAIDRLKGEHVTLELDPGQGDRDRYGRLLAYVWLDDGTLVNELLVAEGYAREYTYDERYRYQDRFRAAEAQARERGAGLWAPDTCDGEKTAP